MRQKTTHGDWRTHYFDNLGELRTGDLQRETNIMRDAAPQFSMRPRTPIVPQRAQERGLLVPGPGEYSIAPAVAVDAHPVGPTAPVWQFGTTDRDKTFNGVMALDPKTPSPQQYTVTRDGLVGRVDKETLPSYSMRPQTQDRTDPEYKQKRSPRPSVHEYDVTHGHVDLIREKSPAYSMLAKSTPAATNSSPAPDAYYIKETVGIAHPSVPTGPEWGFSKTEKDKAFGRIAAQNPKTPSPTEYTVTRDSGVQNRVDQEAAPVYSMRAQTQDYADPEYRQKRSPRPGVHEYDVTHDHVDLVKEKSPVFSMRPKNATPLQERTPAPDMYEIQSAVGHDVPTSTKSPEWQFGSSNRENAVGRIMQLVPPTPSPQQYQSVREGAIGRDNQEKAPSYSMRPRSKDRRVDPKYNAELSPRPSAHEYTVTHEHVDLAKSSAPRYSMRSRSKSADRRAEQVSRKGPGPGSYEFRANLGRDSSPMARKSSAWGFGSANRFKEPKADTRMYTY